MNKQSLGDADVKLCYFGGSGGFVVLHLLLLSGQFCCRFKDQSTSLDKIMHDQWSVTNPRTWKANEFWPDNLITKNSKTSKRKIYFFCNPSPDTIKDFEGSVMLVYLDADAHVKMAHFKHAYKFFHASTSLYQNHVAFYRDQLKGWVNHYRNIKDASWPRCTGPAAFKRLPDWIQKELLDDPATLSHLDIKRYEALDAGFRTKVYSELQAQKKTLENGTEVLEEVFDFFKHADMTIKLTDIMNDLESLCPITGTGINQKQRNLKQTWIALHPPLLLNSIGIKSIWEQTNAA